jgi:hypothetical protein
MPFAQEYPAVRFQWPRSMASSQGARPPNEGMLFALPWLYNFSRAVFPRGTADVGWAVAGSDLRNVLSNRDHSSQCALS